MDPRQPEADGREVLVEREADRPVRDRVQQLRGQQQPVHHGAGHRQVGQEREQPLEQPRQAGAVRVQDAWPGRGPHPGPSHPRRSRRRSRPGPSGRASCAGRARGTSRQPSQHLPACADLAAFGEQQQPEDAGAVERRERASGRPDDGGLGERLGRAAVSARTVAWTTSVAAGRPVQGSMRWWAAPAGWAQRWTLVPEVATPKRRGPAVVVGRQLEHAEERAGVARDPRSRSPRRRPGPRAPRRRRRRRRAPDRPGRELERAVGEPALRDAVEVEPEAGLAVHGRAPGVPRERPAAGRRHGSAGRTPVSAASRASSSATSTRPSVRPSAVRAQSSTAVSVGPDRDREPRRRVEAAELRGRGRSGSGGTPTPRGGRGRGSRRPRGRRGRSAP